MERSSESQHGNSLVEATADLRDLSYTAAVSILVVAPKQNDKRYKQMLALGLTMVSLLVCLPSSSTNRALTTLTMAQPSTSLLDDFLYCTEPYMGDVVHDRARLDVWYQCEGPEYKEFSFALYQYVQATRDKHLPSWGHRPMALPPHAKVLLFGNSHTRQIGQTFACQYANQVVKVQYLEPPNSPDPHMAVVVHFDNGAQLYIVANSYVAHTPHWKRLLQIRIGLALDQLDAIVLGLFNPGSKQWETDFVQAMLAMQDKLPATDELSVQDNFYGPSVSNVAAVYQGPLLFVTLFGNQEPSRTVLAKNAVSELQQQGRHNVKFQNARLYIESMGGQKEGASSSRLDITDADNANVQAHRCTGVHGGHVDLVAWDVREFLFAQLATAHRVDK